MASATINIDNAKLPEIALAVEPYLAQMGIDQTGMNNGQKALAYIKGVMKLRYQEGVVLKAETEAKALVEAARNNAIRDADIAIT